MLAGLDKDSFDVSNQDDNDLMLRNEENMQIL